MSMMYDSTPAPTQTDSAGKKHYRMRCEPGAIGANMSGAEYVVNGARVTREQFIRACRIAGTPEAKQILMQLGEEAESA